MVTSAFQNFMLLVRTQAWCMLIMVLCLAPIWNFWLSLSPCNKYSVAKLKSFQEHILQNRWAISSLLVVELIFFFYYSYCIEVNTIACLCFQLWFVPLTFVQTKDGFVSSFAQSLGMCQNVAKKYIVMIVWNLVYYTTIYNNNCLDHQDWMYL